MGCWHSLWGACLRVPARSMLFLMFSPFPKGLDNTAVTRLPVKFFQLKVVFIFIYVQHSKHRSSFSLDVTLGPGLPYHTLLGGFIPMVFFVVYQRALFQLTRVKMALSGVVLPRGPTGIPALPYASYPPSHHRILSHVHQLLSLKVLYPREHCFIIQVLWGRSSCDFHENSIIS